MDFSKLIQTANANKNILADAQKFAQQANKLQEAATKTAGLDKKTVSDTGKGESNKSISDAVKAQAELATNSAAAKTAMAGVAEKANSATVDAAKQLIQNKQAAADAAKEQAAGALDMWSMLSNKAKSADSGLSALKSLSGMKIGSFSLPNIQIPDLDLPKLADDLKGLTETFNNSEIVKQIKQNIAEVQAKIEARRALAEYERREQELKKEIADEMARKEEEERLQAEEERLNGMYEMEEEEMRAEEEMMMNGSDPTIESGDMAEDMAASAEAAANGEPVDLNTAAAMLDHLGESQAMDDAIMRSTFADQSGEMAEAIAQADQENGWDRRGNGPCGGGTRSVGGINYNTPAEDQAWDAYMYESGYDPMAYDYWYDDYDPYNDPIYEEDEEEEPEEETNDYPDPEADDLAEVAERLANEDGSEIDSDSEAMDPTASIRAEMEQAEGLGQLSEEDRKMYESAIAEAEGDPDAIEDAQEKASMFDRCAEALKNGATAAGKAMLKGLDFIFDRDADVLKSDAANAGDSAPQTKAGIFASFDLGKLSNTVSGFTKHATSVASAVGKFSPKTRLMTERLIGSMDMAKKNVALAHETKEKLDAGYKDLYDQYLAEDPQTKPNSATKA